MKKIFSLLLTGLALTACGEQFQGNFSGQAQIERNECTDRYGTYDMTIRARVSGSSMDFRIIDFRPAGNGNSSVDQQSSALYITGDYFRGLNLFADLLDDTSIEGQDPFYEVTEFSDDLRDAIRDGNLPEEDLREISYDVIEVTGELNSSRDLISTLRIERFTEVFRGGEIEKCEISIFAPELVLEQ